MWFFLQQYVGLGSRTYNFEIDSTNTMTIKLYSFWHWKNVTLWYIYIYKVDSNTNLYQLSYGHIGSLRWMILHKVQRLLSYSSIVISNKSCNLNFKLSSDHTILY